MQHPKHAPPGASRRAFLSVVPALTLAVTVPAAALPAPATPSGLAKLIARHKATWKALEGLSDLYEQAELIENIDPRPFRRVRAQWMIDGAAELAAFAAVVEFPCQTMAEIADKARHIIAHIENAGVVTFEDDHLEAFLRSMVRA